MEKEFRSSIENCVKDAMIIQKRRDIGKLDGEDASILKEEKQERNKQQPNTQTKKAVPEHGD